MSWYTMTYGAIGHTPDPGLIEAKVHTESVSAGFHSFIALEVDSCQPTCLRVCLTVYLSDYAFSPSAGTLQ